MGEGGSVFAYIEMERVKVCRNSVCELPIKEVNGIKLSEDGKILATFTTNKVDLWNTLWNTNTEDLSQDIRPVATLVTDSEVLCVSFCGSLIACGLRNGKIVLWDTESGRCTKTFDDGDGGSVYDVCLRRKENGGLDLTSISSENETLIREIWLIGTDNYIKTWDTREESKNTKSVEKIVIQPIGNYTTDVVNFSNDGEKIIIHDNNHTLKIMEKSVK